MLFLIIVFFVVVVCLLFVFFFPLTLHILDIQHCIPRVSKSHPVLPPQYQAKTVLLYMSLGMNVKL